VDMHLLIARGHEICLKLTRKLRDALRRDQNLILPRFAILHFVRKSVPEFRPYTQLEFQFEPKLQKWLDSQFYQGSSSARDKLVQWTKSRYADMLEAMCLRRTYYEKLHKLRNPDLKKEYQAIQNSDYLFIFVVSLVFGFGTR